MDNKSLIELSDLGSDPTSSVGQAVLGDVNPLLSSAESLSPWQAGLGQADDVAQPQATQGESEYDVWRDATAPPEEDSENPRQRLLP